MGTKVFICCAGVDDDLVQEGFTDQEACNISAMIDDKITEIYESSPDIFWRAYDHEDAFEVHIHDNGKSHLFTLQQPMNIEHGRVYQNNGRSITYMLPMKIFSMRVDK